MPLRTAPDILGVRRDQLPKVWQAPIPLAEAMVAGTAPADETVEVYANHGRWVVECPTCHGAQLAHRADRRFMCNYCGNAEVGGLWRPVSWPSDHEAIEHELGQRPDAANQNWIPGQALEDLVEERVEHEPDPPEVSPELLGRRRR